jgi:hypothetical protein
MSFPNMLDIFKVDESDSLTTSSFSSELIDIYNDSVLLDFNTNIFNVFEAKSNENLNIFSFLSLDDMIELSTLKNNVDELIKVFPSLEDDIELLDL